MLPGQSDLDIEVARLKKQIADAISRRAKAEAQAEVAHDREQQAAKAIQEEFGISPEQAPARIAELEADLAAEAERVRAALERAEASEQ
jgi:hypothetical protein